MFRTTPKFGLGGLKEVDCGSVTGPSAHSVLETSVR